jgi:ATP-dependent exoDNAse (exonuclease V) beta subunit
MNSFICLASAGSGKTTVIINTIQELLDQSTNPAKILVISYTKNAVEEITQRLQKSYSNKDLINEINFHTFHSFCLEFLMESQQLSTIHLLEKRPNISNLVPKSSMENVGQPWQINNLLNKISVESLYYTYFNYEDYKNKFPFEYFNNQWEFIESLIKIIDFLKYILNLWTFGDIVVAMYKLLYDKNGTQYLYNIWQKYDAIFIDECQDFSPMQWDILLIIFKEIIYNMLSVEYKKLFFIFGDLKQSIFNFQGAHLNHFKKVIDELMILAEKNRYPLTVNNIYKTHRLSQSNITFINKLFNFIKMEDFNDHETTASRIGNVEIFYPTIQDNNENTSKKIFNFIEKLIEDGTNPHDIMVIFRIRDQLIYSLGNMLKEKNYSSGLDIINTQNNPLLSIFNDVYNFINGQGIFRDFMANYFFPLMDHDAIKNIIDHINDDGFIVEILKKNPLIEEFYQWKDGLKYKNDIKAYDLVFDVINLKAFKPLFIPEEANNLFNILDHSKKFYGNWQDFFNWLPNTFKTESYGVKMETVYGSKGLESPIVIIADGHKGPVSTQWNNSYFYYNNLDQLNNFINLETKNQWLKENYDNIFKEYIRLMYVATTRAQESLYIFGAYPQEHNSLLFYLKDMDY